MHENMKGMKCVAAFASLSQQPLDAIVAKVVASNIMYVVELNIVVCFFVFCIKYPIY
jgi:hypothetical protein